MIQAKKIRQLFEQAGGRGLTVKDILYRLSEGGLEIVRDDVIKLLKKMEEEGELSFNGNTDLYRPIKKNDGLMMNKTLARTSEGLRDILFDEIDKLATGQSDHQRAKAMSDLAGRILESAKLELEFAVKAKEIGRVDIGNLRLAPPKEGETKS